MRYYYALALVSKVEARGAKLEARMHLFASSVEYSGRNQIRRVTADPPPAPRGRGRVRRLADVVGELVYVAGGSLPGPRMARTVLYVRIT